MLLTSQPVSATLTSFVICSCLFKVKERAVPVYCNTAKAEYASKNHFRMIDKNNTL